MSPILGRGPRPLEVIGALESAYESPHDERLADDLRLVRECGVTRLRYPIRWDRVEAEPGTYRWDEVDAAMLELQAAGLRPIPELVRDASYPRWLEGGFADPRFGAAYVRYCEAFARRYSWTGEYTLFHEPLGTLLACGHDAMRPPYGQGMASLVELFRNVLPGLLEASRRVAALLPRARHLYVDTCEPAGGRGFFVLDLMLGRLGDGAPAFAREVVAAGGGDLLELEPGRVDVVGLSHHADSSGRLADLAEQYARRYRLPLVLAATSLRGTPTDRATWLKYTLEQCERARAGGVPLTGYCWAPFFDRPDWNSMLARCERSTEPVGVYGRERDETAMSDSYRRAAAGARAAELPAYRLSGEVVARLEALLPEMAHFEWQEAPAQADLAVAEPELAA